MRIHSVLAVLLGIVVFCCACFAQEKEPVGAPVPDNTTTAPEETTEVRTTPAPETTAEKTAPTEAPSAEKPSGPPVISKTVKQGETIFIDIPGKAHSAWFGGKQIFLYPQKNGHSEGLMPISVVQKPGTYTLKVQAYNGQTLAAEPVTVTDAHFRKQNIQVSSGTKGLQPEPGELETVGKLKTTLTEMRYWEKPFAKPTPDCMNSPFGVLRYHNGKYTDDYHKGLDLRSPMGRPIKATAAGTVQIARKYRLHGGTVGIDHGQGITSIYIHMSQIAVKPGDHVEKGQEIGKVGSTGFATGPHLHWGLFVNGLPVNPAQWVGSPAC